MTQDLRRTKGKDMTEAEHRQLIYDMQVLLTDTTSDERANEINEALAEVERGETQKFDTVEEVMEALND